MNYFKRLIMHNKDFILKEVLEVRGLLDLILKHRHSGKAWSREEKAEIKLHLKRISKTVPVVLIFLLPGGSILLPFLAETLDAELNKKTI